MEQPCPVRGGIESTGFSIPASPLVPCSLRALKARPIITRHDVITFRGCFLAPDSPLLSGISVARKIAYEPRPLLALAQLHATRDLHLGESLGRFLGAGVAQRSSPERRAVLTFFRPLRPSTDRGSIISVRRARKESHPRRDADDVPGINDGKNGRLALKKSRIFAHATHICPLVRPEISSTFHRGFLVFIHSR